MPRTPRDRSKPAVDPSTTLYCRVRRLRDGVIRKGTILARAGAWQRKYVVEYVTYLGVQASPGKYTTGDHHVWAVGIRNLGEYYADGRVYLARKSYVREEHVYRAAVDHTGHPVPAGDCNAYDGLGGYGGGLHPVEPVPDVEPLPLISSKSASQIQRERMAEYHAQQAAKYVSPSAGAVYLGDGTIHGYAYGKTTYTPPQPKSPEAVLSDFLDTQ